MKPAEHKFLKFLCSERIFNSIKTGTKRWLCECKCGHKRDFWDMGGVRHGGLGEPRKLYGCPGCNKLTWHKIRLKNDQEKLNYK